MRVPIELKEKKVEFIQPMRNKMITSFYYEEKDIRIYFNELERVTKK